MITPPLQNQKSLIEDTQRDRTRTQPTWGSNETAAWVPRRHLQFTMLGASAEDC